MNASQQLEPLDCWAVIQKKSPCYKYLFFDEMQARQFFELLEKSDYFFKKGIIAAGYYQSCRTEDQYFYKAHTDQLIWAGTVVTHIRKTVSTDYYTNKVNLAILKEKVAIWKQKVKKANDSYYSQPWV